MKYKQNAWAIKMQISGHPSPNFMGVFYQTGGPLEDYHDGLRLCVFRTRKQARVALKGMNLNPGCYPMVRVIRVEIAVKEKK